MYIIFTAIFFIGALLYGARRKPRPKPRKRVICSRCLRGEVRPTNRWCDDCTDKAALMTWHRGQAPESGFMGDGK